MIFKTRKKSYLVMETFIETDVEKDFKKGTF